TPDTLKGKLYLAAFYQRKKITERLNFLKRNIDKQLENIQKKPLNTTNFYEINYQLEKLSLDLSLPLEVVEQQFKEVFSVLESYHLSSLFYLYLHLLNHQIVQEISIKATPHFLTFVLEQFPQTAYSQDPVLNLYYHTICLLQNIEQKIPSDYQTWLIHFQDTQAFLSPTQTKEFYNFAQNFCAIKHKQENQKHFFLSKLYDLYDQQSQLGYLNTIEGATVFTNLIHQALHGHKVDFAKRWIHQIKNPVDTQIKIAPEYQEAVYNYTYARLLFYQLSQTNDLALKIQYCQEIKQYLSPQNKFNAILKFDVQYELIARRLAIKVFYEHFIYASILAERETLRTQQLKHYEAAQDHTSEALKRFLNANFQAMLRNDSEVLLETHRKLAEFINFTKRLRTLAMDVYMFGKGIDKPRMAKFQEEVQAAECEGRKWLLAKVETLSK
ncbi:MAG: hypothetical protein ACPGXL_08535, partial [Chitinophagales bacterium]